MKPGPGALLAAAILAAIGASPAQAAALVDLGPLVPHGLNERGDVVGGIIDPDDEGVPTRAGLWRGGTLTPLPAPAGATSGSANAVNASGRIAGTARGPGVGTRALRWDGAAAPLRLPPFAAITTDGDDASVAADVDDAGFVVGSTLETTFQMVGFRAPASGGALTRVGTADRGIGSTRAGAVTPDGTKILGQVTGTSGGAADGWYLWPSPGAAGTRIGITPAPSGVSLLDESEPTQVHNALASDGAVLGYKGASPRTWYVRDPGGAEVPVPGLVGYNAVNARRDVVGTITVPGEGGAPVPHAAIRRADGTVVDLNTLLPPDSGWVLTVATAISDGGAIAGVGARRGTEAGFLLPAALVVDSTGDEPDAVAADGACRTARDTCTLRAAIEEVNRRGDTAPTSIAFAIPGAGASPTIAVGSPLPPLSAPAEIAGGTQPGGGPVRIAGAVGVFPGLRLEGRGSTLRDLVIVGFDGDGVVLAGDGGHTVVSSFIGTDPAQCGQRIGAACPLGNAGAGVRISSAGNRVGSDERPSVTPGSAARSLPGDRNFIANNRGAGVAIVAGTGNQAAGNALSANGGLAIDLGDDGPTPNDAGDADDGPNGRLNAPVLRWQHAYVLPGDPESLVDQNPLPQLRPDLRISTAPRTPLTVAAGTDGAGCAGPYAAQLASGPEENYAVITDDAGRASWDRPLAAGASAAYVAALVDADGNTSELSNCFADRDADGLNDAWEREGADLERDGIVDLPLHELGADPRHKDLFVELDWMTGHALDDAELDKVRKIFADAPVANPDGRTGIDLHLDNGPESAMDVPSRRRWGRFSRSDELPRTAHTGAPVTRASPQAAHDIGYDWGELDAIAAKHLEPVRRPFFHYAVSVRRLRTVSGGAIGVSRGLPHRDFAIGLQPLCPSTTVDCAGPPAAQASTFIHELGHNLGLTHGGVSTQSPHRNLKPPFISVMNYLYVPGTPFTAIRSKETGGILNPGTMDYSRIGSPSVPGSDGTVATLDERALSEPAGFGPTGRAARASAAWFCPPKPGQTAQIATASGLAGARDWDCDGKIEKRPVQADIARAVPGEPPALETLEGSDDWSKVDLVGGLGGALALTTAAERAGLRGDMPAPLLQRIARAKARDRAAPRLTIRRGTPRGTGRKRTVTLTVRARDDRQVTAIELVVGRAHRAVRARRAGRVLQAKVKLRRGRHTVRAIAWDGALRASKPRTVRIRVR